jgi:uncharacterized membrane protein (GlpM family)
MELFTLFFYYVHHTENIFNSRSSRYMLQSNKIQPTFAKKLKLVMHKKDKYGDLRQKIVLALFMSIVSYFIQVDRVKIIFKNIFCASIVHRRATARRVYLISPRSTCNCKP